MKVVLTVQGEERNGEKFEFAEPGSLIFGRSERAQCRIEQDPYVSRFHFLLLINPPEVRLRNLSQTNGTLVDGVLYTQGADVGQPAEAQTLVKAAAPDDPAEAVLKEGSQIEVGYTRITVSIEGNAFCVECGRAVPREAAVLAEPADPPLCSDCRSKRREATTLVIQRQEEKGPAGVAKHLPVPSAAKREAPAARVSASGDVRDMIRDILRDHRAPGKLPEIPGYRIEEELDHGSFGAIFKASRLADGQKVAMKIVRPDRQVTREALSRFKREIRITESLSHPNIIVVLDRGEAGGLFWLAMEYIEDGYDLAKHLKRRRGRLPRPEAVGLMLEALEGLAYAHNLNIIHRDLKPPNILLWRSGTRLVPKITDFGLAKSLENSGLNGSIITKRGAAMGTIPYMPPEQVVDVRTSEPTADVFSMGATLYQMLTGRLIRDFKVSPGFLLRGNEPIRQVVADPPVPIRQRDPSLPSGLAAVVDKALNMNPADRFPNAAAFRDALRSAMT